MADQEYPDIDIIETQEWLDAFRSMVKFEGVERTQFVMNRLVTEARRQGLAVSNLMASDYTNTISKDQEPEYPGDWEQEKTLDGLLRWNAMAMVVRGIRKYPELMGHISTFASSAVLYQVGLWHFFHTANDNHGGDCVFIQGHSAPGIYAHAFLEGRFDKAMLERFRQEVDAPGLSSYPHPWLMPDFWQFPTVSMGLGPIQAIYQARFLKYLHNRGLADTANRKVWAFLGDGETDEPESLGALQIARKEGLDNLIFVINCNLQRLDGPVRGNGKIVQELESSFTGGGWNVIKVLWSSAWDPLFEKDTEGLLKQRLMDMVDGEFQGFKAKSGKEARAILTKGSPELEALLSDLSDEDIENLHFGGHDRKKVYAAYHQAVNNTTGRPTVVLAKSTKGFGLGPVGQGQNTTHSLKKMESADLKGMRDRFHLSLTDHDIEEVSYIELSPKSPAYAYLQSRRKALGGAFPARKDSGKTLEVPDIKYFEPYFESSGERELSTTMMFVRILNTLLKDKAIAQHIVPIVPDESRTFGMEGLFRQIGIYSPVKQRYTPVDAGQLMFYKEDTKGQYLQEGITEAGSFSSWIAAATSYSTNDLPMIPFYIYYSMFGFQRIGDSAWAAADQQARGFLIGATAGRTTLAGEGLQHQDGHSHLLASTIPNCVSYDPTFGFELAVIIQDGLKRMYIDKENIYYYITVMNENYHHPEMPKHAEKGIVKGLYLLKESTHKSKTSVTLLGSGTILLEVLKAAELLKEFDVTAHVWSATSFNELYREAWSIERENRLHSDKKPKTSYVYDCLANTKGPIIAATDYIRSYADRIRAYLGDKTYVVLGTDGFGRSDTRERLRYFFEVNAEHIAYTALVTLFQEGEIKEDVVKAAKAKWKIDDRKKNPVGV